MTTTDALLLFLIKLLGTIAFVVWLCFRFIKSVLREWLELRAWWLEECRASGSGRPFSATEASNKHGP